jgi:hypothetical protein
VSCGCIRMYNEDIRDLYSRERVGTRVVIQGTTRSAIDNATINTKARGGRRHSCAQSHF